MFIRIITNIGQSCWVGAFGGGAANFEVWLVAPCGPPLVAPLQTYKVLEIQFYSSYKDARRDTRC